MGKKGKGKSMRKFAAKGLLAGKIKKRRQLKGKKQRRAAAKRKDVELRRSITADENRKKGRKWNYGKLIGSDARGAVSGADAADAAGAADDADEDADGAPKNWGFDGTKGGAALDFGSFMAGMDSDDDDDADDEADDDAADAAADAADAATAEGRAAPFPRSANGGNGSLGDLVVDGENKHGKRVRDGGGDDASDGGDDDAYGAEL